jgi:hypothetical protein
MKAIAKLTRHLVAITDAETRREQKRRQIEINDARQIKYAVDRASEIHHNLSVIERALAGH